MALALTSIRSLVGNINGELKIISEVCRQVAESRSNVRLDSE